MVWPIKGEWERRVAGAECYPAHCGKSNQAGAAWRAANTFVTARFPRPDLRGRPVATISRMNQVPYRDAYLLDPGSPLADGRHALNTDLASTRNRHPLIVILWRTPSTPRAHQHTRIGLGQPVSRPGICPAPGNAWRLFGFSEQNPTCIPWCVFGVVGFWAARAAA